MPDRYKVVLTASAERDLEEIYDYIAAFDSRANANRVLGGLERVSESLALFPERGSRPPELSAVGIHEYRQVYFKPYRVIYRVEGRTVFIYLITDGHRDMQSVLAQRLLAKAQ